MSATERQKFLETSLYLFRVCLLVPHYDKDAPNAPPSKRRSEEFHVAAHIDDVWEVMARDRSDERVEVEGITREVPVLSVIEPKPEPEPPE